MGGWVATHLENNEKAVENIFDDEVGENLGLFMKNCESQGKIRESEIVLENVDVTQLFSIFCQRIRVINVTYCYIADKYKSGKSQGKFELKNIGHPECFLCTSPY